VEDVSVIIRADRDSQTGEVQEIIEICQKDTLRFQKFVLRARQAST
jgi:hypothetical protein